MFKFMAIVMACAPMIGCIDAQPRIAANATKTVEARLAAERARVVGQHWCVLPVEVEWSKFANSPFSSGSVFVSSSGWSGMSSAKFGYSSGLLDLMVIDIESGAQHHTFNRQVALGSWEDISLDQSDPRMLRYPGVLILRARASDTNNDHWITDEDRVTLHLFDLERHELTQISPQGYHVWNVECLPESVLMVLACGPGGGIDLYRYDPKLRSGRFVAQSLNP